MARDNLSLHVYLLTRIATNVELTGSELLYSGNGGTDLCGSPTTMAVKHTELGVKENFFQAPTEASRRKAQIVTQYFDTWANILGSRVPVIGYADLFAGPGIYENGEPSTPVLICNKVIANPKYRASVWLWFNEGDPALADELERNVAKVPGIECLAHKPAFTRRVVDAKLPARLAKLTIPTLVFADPCGYKGLSIDLVTSVLKGFGNDCVFFFNYNRINMKLSCPVMDASIDELLGPSRAQALRKKISSLPPPEREECILGSIREAICAAGGLPVVYAFRTREGGGTSHHLVFASKSEKGAQAMKRIMAKASSQVMDGVGSCEFDPSDELQQLLFSPLEQIRCQLLTEYAGETITFGNLLQQEATEPSTLIQTTGTRSWGWKKRAGSKWIPRRTKGEYKQASGNELFPRAASLLSRAERMSTNSTIEWTEATWNPLTGCTKVSPGCKHCYAERMSKRLKAMGQGNYSEGFDLALHPHTLELPLRWSKPQMVFVNSMSDLFQNGVPVDFILRVFDTMRRAHWHQFQVLTKRSERLLKLAGQIEWPPNVWMGVSVENQDYVNRIDDLRKTAASIKFLSLEPLLGPIKKLDLTNINWVIVGGESGPGARPMEREWVVEIQQRCEHASVPFFFKQWGGANKKRAGRLLDGRTYDEMPGFTRPPVPQSKSSRNSEARPALVTRR